ncbi:hypothetical protein MSG28_010504 [Choristoneura fumiferana]|uniref:Uncharacterized protein n=1 Tax=Choristoneura fumiferana TaxID=7141 RepID=A0ACC0KKY0_CHOFU|nr:hypothetical protein MSG28_010504 [Choristoneura fumiferana]
MHFWIDKRSQCAYTGRHRVPSSLSAGLGRGRGRVCVGARKGMAAPVHRFAAVDCPPRRPPRTHRHYPPPPMPPVHSSRRQTEEPSLYVEIPPEPPQPTIASLAAARSVTPDTLLRTAALGLHSSPMMAPHLKFGMLVSFALATVFLAGAKYYFDRQVVRDSSHGAGGEVNVVVAAVSMACVCGVGCALSLCRAKPAPLQPPRASVQHRAPRPAPRRPPAQMRPCHNTRSVQKYLTRPSDPRNRVVSDIYARLLCQILVLPASTVDGDEVSLSALLERGAGGGAGGAVAGRGGGRGRGGPPAVPHRRAAAAALAAAARLQRAQVAAAACRRVHHIDAQSPKPLYYATRTHWMNYRSVHNAGNVYGCLR